MVITRWIGRNQADIDSLTSVMTTRDEKQPGETGWFYEDARVFCKHRGCCCRPNDGIRQQMLCCASRAGTHRLQVALACASLPRQGETALKGISTSLRTSTFLSEPAVSIDKHSSGPSPR